MLWCWRFTCSFIIYPVIVLFVGSGLRIMCSLCLYVLIVMLLLYYLYNHVVYWLVFDIRFPMNIVMCCQVRGCYFVFLVIDCFFFFRGC